MAPNEIFIQIKPARMADVIEHALRQAGYKITGSGGFVGEANDGKRDLWVVPPTGSHPDEFGPAIPKE